MRSGKLSLILFLAIIAFLPCAAQNNQYKIDDSCYPIYRKADSLIGKSSAPGLIDQLVEKANKAGDQKALTLAATLRLRHAIRLGQETEILFRYGELKDLSKQTGYLQYYFYAYELISVYYFNKGSQLKGLEYAINMHDDAVQMDNDYGKWFSSKYLADLYLADYQRNKAVECLLEAAETYENTNDPTIKVQSMTKVYTTLAMLSGYGSVKFKNYVNTALEKSKIAGDTLLVYYCMACNSAIENKLADYRHYRDMCLENTLMRRVKNTAQTVFTMTDKLYEGDYGYLTQHLDEISRLEDAIFISDLAAARKDTWLLRDCYNLITQKITYSYENKLNQALMETDLMIENGLLSEKIARQHKINNVMLAVLIVVTAVLTLIIVLMALYIRKIKSTREGE